MYIVDNNRIRKVTVSTGIITCIAGSGTGPNSGGFSGDGGAATSAKLNNPFGVAVDSSGTSFLTIFDENVIILTINYQVMCTSRIIVTTVSAR